MPPPAPGSRHADDPAGTDDVHRFTTSRGTKPKRSASTGRHVPRRDFRVEPYAIAVAEWVPTDLSSRLPRTHWPTPLPAKPLMEGRHRARQPRPATGRARYSRDSVVATYGPGIWRTPDEARHRTPVSGHSPNAETAGPLRVARQSTRRQTLTHGRTDSRPQAGREDDREVPRPERLRRRGRTPAQQG